MKGQVIGKTMPHGYAGSYSRQADMIVDTHPCEAGMISIWMKMLMLAFQDMALPVLLIIQM